MASAHAEPRIEPPFEGGVVVGYDGSSAARRALVWAAEDADRRGAVLHVVRAWKLTTAIEEVGAPFGVVPSMQECEDAVRRSLHRAVELAREETPSVDVQPHIAHAPVGPTLLAASQHADLLVIAARGRGGFVGLMLGSTAEQLVRHASCPVVVVR
jgi:nucleotide-binding universal stress UspA family protein